MSVLDRAALEASPLADLHAIASELTMDGYRRLRKADLIDAIITRQDGDQPQVAADEPEVDDESPAEETTAASRRRRGRRGGRGRGATAADATADAVDDEPAPTPDAERPVPRARNRQAKIANGRETTGARDASVANGRDATGARDADLANGRDSADPRDANVEGVVDLLPNGSGFVRIAPPDPSDADVYISAAQVKRCELVSGDLVSGPRRPPQRSERFASLVRVDTINGKPAADVADRGWFDDLPATFPTERFHLGTEDPTMAAIEWLTPFGRGSRVLITGGLWAGKSHALRQLAVALSREESTTVLVTLAGVRPEELPEWAQLEGVPAATAAMSFAGSSDAQDHAVELAVEQARRVAVRGGHAVVLIDTLDGLHPLGARKALAAARNFVGGGSLTVIATSSQQLGGETTVIALDRGLTAAGRFPALDLTLSGTMRADLLVGEDGARAITEARAQALSGV